MKKITSIILLLSVNLFFPQVAVKDIADVTLTQGASLNFDFDDDGTPEFSFQNTFAVGSMFDVQNVNFITFGTLQTGGWDVMKPLGMGTAIGPQGNFGAGGGDAYINPNWATAAQTFPQGDSYIGVRIKIDGNQHYGWILVSLNNGAVTVKSYAYKETAGASINAGETGTMSASDFSIIKAYIYPNPAQDYVHIESDAIIEEVNAVDISGKRTIIPFNGNILNISHLPQGMYLIQADFADNKAAVFKLVK